MCWREVTIILNDDFITPEFGQKNKYNADAASE